MPTPKQPLYDLDRDVITHAAVESGHRGIAPLTTGQGPKKETPSVEMGAGPAAKTRPGLESPQFSGVSDSNAVPSVTENPEAERAFQLQRSAEPNLQAQLDQEYAAAPSPLRGAPEPRP